MARELLTSEQALTASQLGHKCKCGRDAVALDPFQPYHYPCQKHFHMDPKEYEAMVPSSNGKMVARLATHRDSNSLGTTRMT